MNAGSTNPIRLRKNDNIGYADAEADTVFLRNCFIDTGHVSILEDCSDPRCIVLGRTGSGKTAILRHLADEHGPHCLELAPDRLSLSYISNSNIVGFFEEIGINLEPFYKLLWNHVLVVELLKRKYDISNETKKKSFLESMATRFARDRRKEQALAYLERWGDKFWDQTEVRAKELTQTIENTLKGAVHVGKEPVSLDLEGARKLTTEQKSDIVNRTKTVVDQAQIRELAGVIDLLAEDLLGAAIDTFVGDILSLEESSDPVYRWCKRYLDDQMSANELLRSVVCVLYKIGVVAVKPQKNLPRVWSFLDDPVLEPSAVTPDTSITVHSTFWPALGINAEEDWRGNRRKK